MFSCMCIADNSYRERTGVTRVAETTYPSGAPEFTPVFSGVRVAQCLVVCVVFCRSLFVPLSFGHCVVFPSLLYGIFSPLRINLICSLDKLSMVQAFYFNYHADLTYDVFMYFSNM